MTMSTQAIPRDDRDALLRRLKRVEGQVRSLQRSLEDGGDCAEVLAQFTAASNALRSAGVTLAVTAFESCVVEGTADADQLRRSLLALT